jgi:DNA-binding PadR family transcriptional regulator
MYELLVLGRLASAPMHGYMIAKILGKIVGPCQQMQWGSLYPVLSRLEACGYIQAEDRPTESDIHARKSYSITEAGRSRLHELLLDTERFQHEYPLIFAHKVALFSLLTPTERVYLARHYVVHAQQNIDHLERSSREMIANAGDLLHTAEYFQNVLLVIDHRIEGWCRERAWAEQLIHKEQPVEEAV